MNHLTAAWQRLAGRTVFWHITDDPDFRIDPEFRPRGPDGKVGRDKFLSLTSDVAGWMGWAAGRSYAAEIELPADQENRTWARTTYAGLPEVRAWGESLTRAKVLRVVPVEEAQ